MVQGPDVLLPDLPGIHGQHVARRIEEPGVDGVGVRAAHQSQGGDMVGRNHPGVAGVELILPPVLRQLIADRVHPVSHDQHRPGGCLGKEVPQGPIEAPGQPDHISLRGDQGVRSVDAEDLRGITIQDPLPGIRHAEVPDLVMGVRDQVDDARDRLIGHGCLGMGGRGRLLGGSAGLKDALQRPVPVGHLAVQIARSDLPEPRQRLVEGGTPLPLWQQRRGALSGIALG